MESSGLAFTVVVEVVLAGVSLVSDGADAGSARSKLEDIILTLVRDGPAVVVPGLRNEIRGAEGDGCPSMRVRLGGRSAGPRRGFAAFSLSVTSTFEVEGFAFAGLSEGRLDRDRLSSSL